MSVQEAGFTALLRPFKRTELAKQLGTSRKRVDAWANGITEPPASELPAIATALRVKVEVLVDAIARDRRDSDIEVRRAS
jgi:transcriptional regulator with XRE-family HTH domain